MSISPTANVSRLGRLALAALVAVAAAAPALLQAGGETAGESAGAIGEAAPDEDLETDPDRSPTAPGEAGGDDESAASRPAARLSYPGPQAAPEVASYTMRATLDPALHQVRGSQTIRWRNTSGRPASELRFHLYLNAFANTASTWLRDADAEQVEALEDGGWGWIEVLSLATAGGDDLLPGLEHLSPDDSNPRDRTVARVPLPRPVPPGGEIRLEAEFLARLPRVVARTGYKGDFHLVAQWFPKLGVLEADGTWSCHQFHRSSEFFADFGTYDVSLTVPEGFVVGATGSRQGEPRDNGDGTRTHRYRQQGVHDFAWTAWPRFVEKRHTFRHPELPEVELILLLRPEARRFADRYTAALEHALRLFGTWYGPYPYPTLTMVDPPWGALAAGGMEYPTFITTGGALLSPEATQRPEGVTVHEFGHQYFYGLLATDEFEESFLDEGINTYATARVLREAYGPRAWSYRLWGVPLVFPGVRQEHPQDTSARFFKEPTVDPIARTSWGYLDRSSYSSRTYSKMALLMEQVERTVGREAMERAMAVYTSRFRYRHPRSRDLIETLSRETGRDLRPHFRQGLFGSVALDYAVTVAETRAAAGPTGVFGRGGERREVREAEEQPGYESEVVVRRLGDFTAPVSTELVFDDGRSLRLSWDGGERWVRYRVRGPRLLSAEVDPDEVLLLDVDRLNNSRLTRPDRRASRRWGQRLRFWVQNLLETFATFA